MSRALALAIAAIALLAACGRGHEYDPDWVIHSRVVFLSPDLKVERESPPAAVMRLWFPYVSGDFYGPPNTGSFYEVTLNPDRSFELDLNKPHQSVMKSLQGTSFSMRWLRIGPADARIARLLPFVLQADGIEPLGQADWVDADTRRRLMLVYFDRAARIFGSEQVNDQTMMFDISSDRPGYVWIGRADNGRTSEWTRSRANRVLLAVTAPQAR